MNKTLRDFLAVLVCFCMVCSLCGVGFAVVDDASDAADLELPAEDGSEDFVDEQPDVALEAPPPVPDVVDVPVSEAPEDPVELPVPDDGVEAPAPVPDDGDDEPDVSDPGDVLPAPIVVLPVGDSPDVTYVQLPADYVIKSASLDDSYAIDPASLAPVTPSGSSGLKAVLLSILGNYDPIVAQYQYNNGSNYSYIREIQPDYVWLCSAAVFAILLYCTWRFLGGLVCRT